MKRQSDWDISVEDLAELINKGASFRLIDVREPLEHEICNQGGDLIPLRTLAERVGELDTRPFDLRHDESTIELCVVCRRQSRSEDLQHLR